MLVNALIRFLCEPARLDPWLRSQYKENLCGAVAALKGGVSVDTWAILIAAGKEERVSDGVETAFLTLSNRPVIGHSLLKFERSSAITNVIVVVDRQRMDRALHLVKMLGCSKVRHIVAGGVNRPASLKAGMKYLPEPEVLVVVHEVSRPAFDVEVLEKVVRTAKRYGCAVAASKIPDVVKMTEVGARVTQILERNKAWISQSPLAFRSDIYARAMRNPLKKEVRFSDDESAYIEAVGEEVRLVESGSLNIRIRTADDLQLLSAVMRED